MSAPGFTLQLGNSHIHQIIPLPETDSRDKAYVLLRVVYCNNSVWLSQGLTIWEAPVLQISTPAGSFSLL